MSGRSSWTRSGARPATKQNARSGRPPGSWDAALDRARRDWDALTGGPQVWDPAGLSLRYSDGAAAAILALAVALWPSVAADMAADQDD